jgi:hypothetical protein
MADQTWLIGRCDFAATALSFNNMGHLHWQSIYHGALSAGVMSMGQPGGQLITNPSFFAVIQGRANNRRYS